MSKSADNGFFYRPQTIQWILRIFYGLSIFLVLLELFIHRHTLTPLEKIPAFYALYGFVACVILVVIAAKMRQLLMRDENYYESDKDAITIAKDLQAKE